jgi:hypothetical protein
MGVVPGGDVGLPSRRKRRRRLGRDNHGEVRTDQPLGFSTECVRVTRRGRQPVMRGVEHANGQKVDARVPRSMCQVRRDVNEHELVPSTVHDLARAVGRLLRTPQVGGQKQPAELDQAGFNLGVLARAGVYDVGWLVEDDAQRQ